MPTFQISTLAYVLWFIATLGLSVALLWRIPLKSEPEEAIASFAALVTACHLALVCCVPLVLTIAGVTSPTVYIVLSGCFLAATIFRLATDRARSVPSRTAMKVRVILSCGLLAFVPTVLGNIAPISETDSLDVATIISKWAGHTAGIYDLPSGYPSFWELSYLPSFILTRSDAYFWVVSMEAVLLFGLAAYLLAREFRLPPVLSLLAALNGVAIYHFWYGPSGVMTLKVDMVFAAGTLLLIIACIRMLRERYDFQTVLYLGLGCAFLLTKYTGAILIGFGLVLLGALLMMARRRIPRPFLRWCGIAMGAVIALPGHYYIRNVVLHGNILYPLQLRVLGITLPGRVSGLAGTSIFSHLGERELWDTILVPPRFVHYCGVLFPFVLVGFFLFASALLAGMVIAIVRRQDGDYALAFLAAFAIAGWLLYGNAPWSAGTGPKDLFYLAGMASMRYISAILFLSELFLVVLLARYRWGRFAASLLLALDFASRIYILDLHVPPIGSVSIVGMLTSPAGRFTWIGMAVVALLCSAVLVSRTRWIVWAVSGISSLALLCVAPAIVNVNREVWGQRWQPMIRQLAFAAPARVFVIDSWEPQRVNPYVYLAQGVHAQHSVVSGSMRQLFGNLAGRTENPDFIFLTSLSPYAPGVLDGLERDVKRFDYLVVASTPYGALYRNSQPVKLQEVGKVVSRAAMYCPDSACIATLDGNSHSLSTGMVYSGTPPMLWLRKGSALRPLIGVDGDCVDLENIGFRHLDGSLSGLRACSKAGRWNVDYGALDPMQSSYLVSSMHPDDVTAAGWSITGNVRRRTEVIAGPEGKYIRIRSEDKERAAGWIALVYLLPDTVDAHGGLALRAKVRCHAAGVNAHYFDFGQSGLLSSRTNKLPNCGDWSYVSISHIFSDLNKGDYMAIGMFDLGPDSYLDVQNAEIIKGLLPEEAGND